MGGDMSRMPDSTTSSQTAEDINEENPLQPADDTNEATLILPLNNSLSADDSDTDTFLLHRPDSFKMDTSAASSGPLFKEEDSYSTDYPEEGFASPILRMSTLPEVNSAPKVPDFGPSQVQTKINSSH